MDRNQKRRNYQNMVYRLKKEGKWNPSSKLKKLNPNIQLADWTWIAGLIDGEGTITLYTDKDPVTKQPRILPRVHISNTSKPLLIAIKNKLGCGYIFPKQRQKPTYKQCYLWCTTSMHQVATILQNIEEHLIVKKNLANLLLEYCNRRGPNITYDKRDLSIYEKVKEINYKSKHNPKTLTSKYYIQLKEMMKQDGTTKEISIKNNIRRNERKPA